MPSQTTCKGQKPFTKPQLSVCEGTDRGSGNDVAEGETPQAMVPAGAWFGSRVKGNVGFVLVSCTVAPGFDFADFELADRAALIRQVPELKETIEAFTKEALG